MVNYFCELCGDYWNGAPIQAELKTVCFDCLVVTLNQWRQQIRHERKRNKKKRKKREKKEGGERRSYYCC